MGANSKIEWTTHTFNPWIGCAKVSEGCKNCYAEVQTFPRVQRGRGLELWGPKALRHRTSAGNWKLPLRWNAEAIKALHMTHATPERPRVFCASLADVFEDRRDLDPWRADLFRLIESTQALDWLLLTKRPEKVKELVPAAWRERLPFNVWLGTTVEHQEAANDRIAHLLDTPAAVRFLSVEPMVGPVDLCKVELFKSPPWPAPIGGTPYLDVLSGEGFRPSPLTGVLIESSTDRTVNWVIVGGESGPAARPCDLAWIRQVVEQCTAASVPVFVKQLGAKPLGYTPEGFTPADPKGGNIDQFPPDLQLRQIPTTRT